MTRRRRPEPEPPRPEGPRGVSDTEAGTLYVGGVTGATGASGSAEAWVGLPSAPVGESVSVSSNTLRLASMPSTVALETNLARLPMWVASSASSVMLQLALPWTVGTLYGEPVRILETQGHLTVSDMRLVAHAIKRYAEAGCPEDRRARFTLNEASRWSGHRGKGGRQLRLVRDAFMRLRATALETTVRHVDGHTESLAWGLIDRGWTDADVGREAGSVTFSDELARLVREGSLTYLDAPTLDALADRDEVAARLWVYLEAERIDAGGHWARLLYSAPEGEPERERDTPAIADLLRLSGWERRRDVRARVDRAMRVVAAVDPRYRYTLLPSAGRRARGMWTLRVARAPGRPLLPPGLASEAGTYSRASLPERVPTVAEAGTADRASGYSESRERVLPVAHSASKEGGTVGLPSVSTSGLTSRVRARETETRDKSRTRDEAIAAALAEGRPDIVALLERTGWSRVTSGVRRDLDDLADRHDLTGYQWAADRIREAPECEDPHGYMAAVYAAERAYKAERALEAEAVERVQREREREARRRPVADEWDSAAASVPETVRETVASRPRPDGPLPPPEPEPEAAETPEETRARRIAAARAVLDASLSGYAADKARATLREYGEEP